MKKKTESTTRIMDPVVLRALMRTQLCVTLVLLAYALAGYLNAHSARKHRQFFVERDPSLSYPELSSTVPTSVLGITSSLVPAVSVCLANYLRWRIMIPTTTTTTDGVITGLGDAATTAAASSSHRHSHSTTHDDDDDAVDSIPATATTARGASRGGRMTTTAVIVHLCVLELFGMGQALFLTMGSYNVVKAVVGRLRPNFFAACDYKGYAAGLASGDLTAYLNATSPGTVGDVSFCLAPLSEVDEASLSFPSGHAALSFAGMTYATLALLAAISIPHLPRGGVSPFRAMVRVLETRRPCMMPSLRLRHGIWHGIYMFCFILFYFIFCFPVTFRSFLGLRFVTTAGPSQGRGRIRATPKPYARGVARPITSLSVGLSS